MKLKNKILPITIISASAGMITPLITLSSCSSNRNMTTYDMTTTGYKSTIDPISKVNLERVSSTCVYRDDPTAGGIFKDDYLTYAYKEYQDKAAIMALNGKIKQYKISMTDPIIGKTAIVYPGYAAPMNFPTVSFDVIIEEEYEINQYDAWNHTVKTTKKVSYKNVPFYVTGSAEASGASAISGVSWGSKADKLSINANDEVNFGDFKVSMFNGESYYAFYYMDDPWSVTGSIEFDETLTNVDDPSQQFTDHKVLPFTYEDADSLFYSLSSSTSDNGALNRKAVDFGFYSHHLSNCVWNVDVIANTKGLECTTNSPWDTTKREVSTRVPVNPLLGITFLNYENEETFKTLGYHLGNNEPIYCPLVGTEYREKFLKGDYELVIPANASISINAETGAAQIQECYIANFNSLGVETDVDFDQLDCGSHLFFKIPYKILPIVNTIYSGIDTEVSIEDSQIINVGMTGSMPIKKFDIVNKPTQSGTNYVWDGKIALSFQYDAGIPNPEECMYFPQYNGQPMTSQVENAFIGMLSASDDAAKIKPTLKELSPYASNVVWSVGGVCTVTFELGTMTFPSLVGKDYNVTIDFDYGIEELGVKLTQYNVIVVDDYNDRGLSYSLKVPADEDGNRKIVINIPQQA